jgi:hypothetical protein
MMVAPSLFVVVWTAVTTGVAAFQQHHHASAGKRKGSHESRMRVSKGTGLSIETRLSEEVSAALWSRDVYCFAHECLIYWSCRLVFPHCLQAPLAPCIL